MVAVNRTPNNQNYLSVIGYNLILHRAPHIEFFVRNATIPSLNLPPVEYPNHFVNLPLSGDHITYEPLTIEVIMDENLEGYQEMHNWLTGLGFPKDYSQYKELDDNDLDALRSDGKYSDISLTLLTNLKNPNIVFNFRDAWPTNITGWQMSNEIEDVMYASCEVTFAYSYFDVEIVRADALS
jgi:hypothetical protein